jgi:hypothetical protein
LSERLLTRETLTNGRLPMLASKTGKPPLQAENVALLDKIAPAKNVTVTVSYTVVTAERLLEGSDSYEALLTKRLWRGEDGALVKQAAANPARGTFTHVEHTGTAEGILGAYGDVLHSLSSHQAIIAARLPSPLRSDGSKWRLTTKNAPEPGALPRSQTTFHPVAGPALISLDFDIPEVLRQDFATAADLYRKVLLPAWPGFAEVALLVRVSVSSGAKLIGAADPFPTGYHIACIVSDGTKVEAFALALFDRIALLGFALVEPSRCGAALKRALVDVAAARGSERLIFEADPVVGTGVERVPRPLARYPGGMLEVDVELAAMALTGADRKQLRAIWVGALAKAQPELKAAKEKWLEARGGEIAKARNVKPKVGRRIAEHERFRFEAGELHGDFPIHLDSGEWITVYQILSDPGRYAGARCWSLDETVSRPGVGFIHPYLSKPDPTCGKPPGPWLHSFEHGGRYFRLRSVKAECERIKLLRGTHQRKRS